VGEEALKSMSVDSTDGMQPCCAGVTKIAHEKNGKKNEEENGEKMRSKKAMLVSC